MVSHDRKDDSIPGYETRDVNIKMVVGIGLIGILLLVIILFGLDRLFTLVTEQQIKESVLIPVSQELVALRATEDSILSSYGVVNPDKGIYRIPIDSAMVLMAKEYQTKSSRNSAKAYSLGRVQSK